MTAGQGHSSGPLDQSYPIRARARYETADSSKSPQAASNQWVVPHQVDRGKRIRQVKHVLVALTKCLISEVYSVVLYITGFRKVHHWTKSYRSGGLIAGQDRRWNLRGLVARLLPSPG
jgi:hypothetical protein